MLQNDNFFYRDLERQRLENEEQEILEEAYVLIYLNSHEV